MDSRVLGTLLLLFGLVGVAAVGGVAGDTQIQGETVGEQGADGVGVADAQAGDETNETGGTEWEDRHEVTVLDDASASVDGPGIYVFEVADLDTIHLEVGGPGGGGAGHDNGAAEDGGDGGYVEGVFDVSEFEEVVIHAGGGGGGGSPDGGGTGGDGFYSGGDGGLQDGVSFHSAAGGGGGSTIVEGVGETTEQLAAAGGGGGGAGWDSYLGGSDNTGGGGGAAGGDGGTAEGGAVGGGTDGEDAEESGSDVGNFIGGDGGDSAPNSADPGDDGSVWVNDDYAEEYETTVGGGGDGGDGGAVDDGEAGADGDDGWGAFESVEEPELVVDSLSFPDEVSVDDTLDVEYVVENIGTETGTESAVELLVDDETVDADTDVTLDPDESTTGTLTFEDVDQFEGGDVIEFTVALAEFEDSESGETDVVEPELVVESLSFPPVVQPDEDLDVEYTIENVGSEAGTESAVELLVGDATVDADTDVTVGAGESATGTLTFADDDDEYGAGDTIAFTVALAEFGDSESGETDIQDPGDGPALVVFDADAPASLPPGADLDVEYTIENIGDEAGTESAVELLVDDETVDTDTDVTVGAGDSTTGTLTFEDVGGSFEGGDTIAFTVALADFDDSMSGETDVLESGEINLAVKPASVVVDPDESQTYEVVVEGADAGILGYDEVAVEVDDPAVGNITAFEEQLDEEADGVFSNSEIQDDGAVLHLEAAAGDSFADPAAEQVIATFDVEATGDEGEATALEFDGDAAQTVAEFDGGAPYDVDQFEDANLILDAGEGPNLLLTDVDAPDEIDLEESLEIEYTVENFGDEAGTESAVELTVGGETVDTETEVAVGAGGTASGTLTFADVADGYEAGDTIEWTVALETFDDSDGGTTDIAGEQVGAEFAVDIDGTNSPVTEGEDIEVTAAVENAGDEAGEASVVLSVGELGEDSAAVSLDPGESTAETLSVGTAEEDAGTYTAEVTAGEAGDTETVEVIEDAGEAAFEVTELAVDEQVVEGEDIEVTATVENVGDVAGSQTVDVHAADLDEDSVAVEDVQAGAAVEVTAVLETEIGDAAGGVHEIVAETETHSATAEAEIHLPTLPGHDNPPQDATGDGLYEDVDGDGTFDIFDVQTFFNHFESDEVQNHAWAYDHTRSGDVDIFDVQEMFNKLD